MSSPEFGSIERALDRIASLLIVVATALLGLMAMILCWQVFARYVLNASPAWSEQLSLALMLWFVFLGAAAGFHQQFHIRIAEGVDRMSPEIARVAKRTAYFATSIFSSGLLVWGIEVAYRTWSNDVPTLPVSKGMIYIVIPLSAAFIFASSLCRVIEREMPPGDDG